MTNPKRRKRSARFVEIAAEAGVSVATVDRVLNERDSVSEKARRKVLAAARELAVPRLLPEPEHALLHIDIVLPRNETPFHQRLAEAFRDGAAMLDRRVIVHRRTLPERDVGKFVRAIRTPHHSRAGVIFAAPDTTEIRDAVAKALGRGEAAVAVVTTLPDLPGLVYCGMDNRRAGRVAGRLMGQMARAPGRAVVLGNARLYRAHQERHEGFVEALAGFPHLAVQLIEAETRDEEDRCFNALRRALAAAGQPIVGVYNTGAGSAGIHRVLAADRSFRPVWIGHEASDDHVAYLRDDLMEIAIDQDPAGQAMAALQNVLRHAGVLDPAKALPAAELRLHTKYTVSD